MSKRSRLYQYLIVFAINIVFISAALAIYSQLLLREYRSIDLQVEGDWLIQGDETLGYVRARNAVSTRTDRNTATTYQIFSDHRGARVNKTDQPTKDTAAIVSIGGSFTEGSGIQNEATFTSRLGSKFDASVANFGVGSYGTVQSLQLLQRNRDLNPRVVIYGFISDHLRRNLSPCAPAYGPYCLSVSHVDFDQAKQPFLQTPLREYPQELYQSFLQEVAWEHGSLGDDIKWATRLTLKKFEDNSIYGYDNSSESQAKGMTFLIDQMFEVTDSIGAQLVVVYIPYLERGQTNPPPAELLQALTPGVIFVDMTARISEHYQVDGNPSLKIHELDGHPNEIGHDLIAEEIYRVLQERSIL